MKPAAIALIAITASCQPAMAGIADFQHEICMEGAALALHGAEDGLIGASLLDGVDEAITAVNAGGNEQAERMAAASYLFGYADGLLQYQSPEETANQFYAGCIEGAIAETA
ncbi:hypothetical protein [Paracoccus alkanivorans]|uniref:Uncharacterized protein n=1 Tax=Paracoccus alkanivorans TaxID=2116655 RepID=A0A3M0M7Y5_9RHOB|nr:hypothetical protein [Paracoccus alkanivorans]RMC33739.1 hypothetical protein C9E81_15660 [Paracoccus alkanivorans]